MTDYQETADSNLTLLTKLAYRSASQDNERLDTEIEPWRFQ